MEQPIAQGKQVKGCDEYACEDRPEHQRPSPPLRGHRGLKSLRVAHRPGRPKVIA